MSERLTADVAIIGGGIAGCSTALHLRRRGASVVLLERGVCGGQASGVNYGGGGQQGGAPPQPPPARGPRGGGGRPPPNIGPHFGFMAAGHNKLPPPPPRTAEL